MTKYLALLAGMLLATAASAGDDKDYSTKSTDQKFERLDSDQSSSISMREASKDEELTATFASVDADGDGELSQTEYTAHLTDSGSDSESSSSYPSEEE